MSRFEWQGVETEYREVRRLADEDELRWIVNRETIRDTITGQTFNRGTLRHPGICVIVPFLDPDRVLLIHQYRYAAGQSLWELPAGTLAGRLENGRMLPEETPEACARRELVEETGYEAREFQKVCECYTMPGTSDEIMHVFFARDLTRHEQSLDIGEVIDEVRAFPLAEVAAMIEGGEIRDAKTLVGMFFALRRSASR